MNVQELRKTTGLSQGKFAKYFNIPASTLRKWEQNATKPPVYIPEMIEKILKMEQQIAEKNNKK